jgi:hypothetical protein
MLYYKKKEIRSANIVKKLGFGCFLPNISQSTSNLLIERAIKYEKNPGAYKSVSSSEKALDDFH